MNESNLAVVDRKVNELRQMSVSAKKMISYLGDEKVLSVLGPILTLGWQEKDILAKSLRRFASLPAVSQERLAKEFEATVDREFSHSRSGRGVQPSKKVKA